MKACTSIATLTDYIGAEAVAQLVRAHGGATIKVPKSKAGATWARLRASMGDKAAGDLCAAFGGEGLYIPTDKAAEVEQTRQRVRDLVAQGMSFSQVAQVLTVTTTYTERGIRKLLNGEARRNTPTAEPVSPTAPPTGHNTPRTPGAELFQAWGIGAKEGAP